MQFGRKRFLPLLLALSMLLSLLPIPAAALQTEPMEIWEGGQAPAPAAPFPTGPFAGPEQSGQTPFQSGPIEGSGSSGQAPSQPGAEAPEPTQAPSQSGTEAPEQSGQAFSDGELHDPAPEDMAKTMRSAPPPRLFNTAPVIESSGKTGFSATIKWNDNNNAANKRPAIGDALGNYTLNFSYTTHEGPPVTGSVATNFAQLGLTQAPVPVLVAEGGGSVSNWSYSVSGLPLAVKITTTPEDAEPQSQICPVTYTLTQAPFNGYLPTDPPEAGNAQTITNTVTQDWRGTIRWFDDKDYYGTRPNADAVKNNTRIYRYVPGETAGAPLGADDGVTLKTGDPRLDSDGRAFYEVTLENAPAYDESGMPYTYYIEPYAATQKPDAGAYTSLYVNEDNYASQTDALYNDGTATFTLTNTTGFAVNKDWSDNNNPGRPANVKLYLYRVPVEMVNDSPVLDIDTARPVQGHDSIFVPASDGLITLAQSGSLPMYDASGCKYVYFAKEVGLPTGRDYHFIIDNSGSPESDAIKRAFDEQTTTYLKVGDLELKTPIYVLSDGAITNKLTAATQIPVAKEFKAQAMQNMAGASVTMQLQWSSDGGGSWKDVEAGTSPHLQGDTAVTIDGFSAERMSLTGTGPVVDKYDADGRAVVYRWVERSVAIDQAAFALDNGVWRKNGDIYTYTDAQGSEIRIRVDGKGPGVGSETTTAYFRPTMTVGSDGSTSVTNTLVGKTQVQVKKTWSSGGQPVTALPAGTEVTVRLRRVEGNLTSGTPTVPGNLTNANGQPVYDITLDGDEGEPWTAMWDDLVRYDETGKEYTYAVTELDGPEDWTTEISYTKSIASDGEIRFTQLTANVSNSTGPGEGLEFEVEKQWLDGGDLLTRKPVVVGLYRIKSDGQILDTSVEVRRWTLNAANNWWHKFDVTPTGTGDTVDNYVVKEISAAGAIVVNYDFTDEDIYTRATATDFDTTYPYESRIGTLGAGESDPDGLLGYVYNVYIQRTGTNPDGTHAAWQVSNQRTGVMTIELNKTWRAGGEAPAAEFKLTRTGGGETDQEIGSVTLGSGGSVAAADSGGVMIATYTFRGAASDGLLKYDTLGEPYSYDLKEISVGGEPIGSGGSVTLPSTGDRYATGISLSKIDIKGGGVAPDGTPNHHTGDVYTYAASNNKVDTYSLTARKLWRDSGSSGGTARPDIYFNVYRVADDYVYEGQSLETLAKNEDEDTEKLAQGLQAALAQDEATLIATDKLWNTNHNDWYWSCDLGSVQRYDATGNRYIYFLVEKTSGNAGNYRAPVYYNAAYDVASVQWRPKGHDTDPYPPTSSQQVFDVPLDTMKPYCGDVLILADGTNSGADGSYSDYYAGTVMNYQQENRTVSFRKVWKMPAGWPNLTDQMPTITVELWRTTEPIRDENGDIKKTCTKEEIKNAENRMVKVNSVTLSPPFTRTFITDSDGKMLARYDEWGNTYYYYLYEETDLIAYASDMVAFDTGEFFITNTYKPKPPHVEVDVSKTWISEMDGVFVKDLAPATFRLYAQMTDGSGVKIGSAILMSTMTLDPASLGSVSSDGLTGKFLYLTGSAPHPEPDAQGVTFDRLPWRAPNDNPFAYWVEEAAPPAGYKVEPAREINVTLTSDGTTSPAIYKGAAEYTNTYTGGSTSAAFTKRWEDGNTYIDNAAYRPAKVRFEIYRKIAGGEGGPAKDTAGNPIIVILSDGVWSKTVTNLPAYGPDGKAYTYYVHAEALLDNNEHPVTAALYTSSGIGTKTVTNTLKTVSRTAKKAWMNNATSAALDWTTFTELRTLGALPHAVGFVVQSKAVNSSIWANVLAKAGGTGNVIGIGDSSFVGRQYVLGNMSQSTFTNLKNTGVTFDTLPQFIPDGTTAIDYRVAEVVWTDANTYKVIEPGATGDAASFTGGRAAITSDGTLYTATNTLTLTKVKLEKTWVDDGNRENTRPGSVIMTVSKAGGSDGFSRALTSADKTATGDGNVWAADVYVPAATDMGAAYTVTEALPADWAYTYTQSGPVWADDTCAFTNTYDLTHHVRATLGLEATKTFALDGDWAGITRPDVTLSLQYRDQADTEWLAIDQNNIAEFATSDGGVYPLPTQTLRVDAGQTSKKATWSGMYTYWKVDDAGGTAKPIRYRVVETMPGAPYTSAPTDGAQAFTGAAGAGVLTAAITNTLTLDTRGIKLEKKWEDSAGKPIGPDKVKELIGLGALPETLSFKLQYSSDGTAWLDVDPGKTTTMDSSGQISGKQWDIHLPTHDKDGKELQYRAVETGAIFKDSATEIAASALGNITLNSSGAVEPGDTAEITNTYGQHIEVSVEKTWDQGKYTGITHPAAAKVQLYRDGAAYGASVELTEAENWAHTWTLLPQYQNGSKTLSQYTVKELDQNGNAVADGGASGQYTVTYGGTQAGGLTLTNTYAPGELTINATKIWDDNDDPYGLRPSEVELTLWATSDGRAETQPDQAQWSTPAAVVGYTLSATQTLRRAANGSWGTVQWTVPSYVYDQQMIYYRVSEESPQAGYTATLSDVVYSQQDTGSASRDVTITNTLDQTAVTYWTVALEFDGDDMKQAVKDKGISGVEVRLQYRKAGAASWTDAAPKGGTVVLSDGNAWAHTFEDLLPGYAYRVVSRSLTESDGTIPTQGQDGTQRDEEVGHTGPYGYISEYDPAGDPEGRHTLIIMTYAKGNLKVAKVWKGGGSRPAGVEVQLWQDGALYNNSTVLLDPSNAWSHTWTELPVFDASGTKYQYEVKEISNLSRQYTVAISPAKAELTEGATTNVTVTNTYISPRPGGTVYDFPLMPSGFGFGGVRVHKTVTGPYGGAGRFNFTMTLSDMRINGRYGDLLFVNGVAQFALPHNGAVTADGLPAGVEYTITEHPTAGYISYPQNARGVVVGGQMAMASFENRNVKPIPQTSDDNALVVLPVALGISLLGLIACLLMRRRMGAGAKAKGKGRNARLRTVMLLICCCFAATTLANGVLLCMEALQYTNSADTYKKLTSFVEFLPKAPDEPGETTPEDARPDLEASTVTVDFAGLRQTGPDVVAWLLQEDTALNYPIVQGRDNDYYLRRLYNGAQNKAGSLFMDYENQAGFTDGNTVVYGHNMRDGSMFASLLGYAEQAYYDEHRTMRLVTEDGAYTLRVFAAFHADPAESGTASSPWTIAWEDKAAYGAWLAAMRERSVVDSGFQPAPDGRVMTLSTCTRDGNGRFVVMGELIGVDQA